MRILLLLLLLNVSCNSIALKKEYSVTSSEDQTAYLCDQDDVGKTIAYNPNSEVLKIRANSYNVPYLLGPFLPILPSGFIDIVTYGPELQLFIQFKNRNWIHNLSDKEIIVTLIGEGSSELTVPSPRLNYLGEELVVTFPKLKIDQVDGFDVVIKVRDKDYVYRFRKNKEWRWRNFVVLNPTKCFKDQVIR